MTLNRPTGEHKGPHPGLRGGMPAGVVAVVLIFLSLVTTARAQAPEGHIASIFPAGGRQGESVQVTIRGTDLAGAKGVRLSGGGITGEIVSSPAAKPSDAKGAGSKRGKSKEGEEKKDDVLVTVSLRIDADAAAGEHDLRLVTPGGVTNRARFFVSGFPELPEKEPNSELAKAQVLPALPVVVNGQAFEADCDYFRFAAKAGETVVCQVQAQQLLPFIADAVPGWFQAVLTLSDAQGTKLASVDDFRFHPDPLLIYKIPRDGDYVVEIHDALYRGREDFVYRLTLGVIPYITHVYPLGSDPRGRATLELFGVNLPKPQATRMLSLDGPSIQEVELSPSPAVSRTLPLALGRTPQRMENEPNNVPEKAMAVETPATINGRIQQPGDVDYFSFSVKAKEKLVLEVLARRLDSPLDSVLTLQDAHGKTLASNDDNEDDAAPQMTHHADSRLVYTFPTAGRYVLKLADVQGKGGPEYAYRLVLAPPDPDFELRLVPDNPRAGQGAPTVLTVYALRHNGFNGPINLSLENLPKGFTASGTTIPEDTSETLLTLLAPSDASLGTYTPTIVGQATIGDRTITHPAVPTEDLMQAFIYHHLLPTQELLFTVVEPSPFQIVAQLPPEGYVRFGAGRTAYVDVKATRTAKATGPIRLSLHNPPKGFRMKPVVLEANQDTAKVEITVAVQHSQNFRQNLILNGTMRQGGNTVSTITPAIPMLGASAKAPGGKKPKP